MNIAVTKKKQQGIHNSSVKKYSYFFSYKLKELKKEERNPFTSSHSLISGIFFHSKVVLS